jgi:hypothetical protein
VTRRSPSTNRTLRALAVLCVGLALSGTASRRPGRLVSVKETIASGEVEGQQPRS